MFHTLLRDIDFQHVKAFCQTLPEGVRVAYKQQPVQIPKIVSSFANTFGGIWVIGVETNKATNMPLLPIQGIPAQPGIEEQITQACWNGVYPPLTPEIKVIPADPGRVVVVVRMPESIEAPHAIENTTRVYIRTNSITQPIQFAEMDRIEYLLKRRHSPEHRREQMIEATVSRAGVQPPCLQVIIGPKYPYQPLLTEDQLTERLQSMPTFPGYRNRPWSMRRIQQGFISLQNPHMSFPSECFEVNLYGLISYAQFLESGNFEGTSYIRLVPLVIRIGAVLRMAAFLLKETTTNLFIRVCLEGLAKYMIVADHTSTGLGVILEPVDPSRPPTQNPPQALENTIVAETDALRETLDEEFTAHVTELVRRLMWAFDWADIWAIASRTAAILQTNGLDQSN
jgi:hypothetical protein